MSFINKQKNMIFYVAMGVLFAISIFIAFYKLEVMLVECYDEARHGVNAYEMIKNNNFIVNTYQYSPDYWNLKPPLSSWLIVLCYKIFGYNMLGLKFYSSLAFVLMVAFISIYTLKFYGRKVCVVSVFCTLSLYTLTDGHLVRFADADMLYCLLYICSFMLITSKDKYRYVIGGICGALAFLTKSYHAGIIYLCSVISVLLTDKKLNFKHIAVYSIGFAMPMVIWMGIRYQYDGFRFLKAMIFTDVMNRAGNDIEHHGAPIWFYVLNLVMTFKIMFAVTVISAVVRFIRKKKVFAISNETVIILIWIVLPMFLYSLSKSKWTWYVYPQFFLLTILLAKYIADSFEIEKKSMLIIFACLMILPGRYVYSNIFNVMHWEERQADFPQQVFLAEGIREIDDDKKGVIYFDTASGDVQDLCLISELYGDLICKEGGKDGFMAATDTAYVLIDAGDYDEKVMKHTSVVKQYERFLLLKKEF